VNGETDHRRTHNNRWHMAAYDILECNMVQMPSCACSWPEHGYTADTDITRENQQYRYDSNCLFRCINLNINHTQIIFIKISGWLSHLYFLLTCVNISIWSIGNVGIECAHSELWDNKKSNSNRWKIYIDSSVACFTSSPWPFSKRFLRMRSSASSFNFQYPLFSSRSSSSCLRFLPRLTVTSTLSSNLPSITWFWKQFPRKTWSIKLVFLLMYVGRIYFNYFTAFAM
jgi:hypothetical protein